MSAKDIAVVRTMKIMMSALFGLFVVLVVVARQIAY